MPYQSINLSQIDPNPHRDLKGNPLLPEHIEHLVASVRSTGFWSNVTVRPKPGAKGRFQLAFGHARIEAAKEAGIKAAEFQVRDISDEDMLRMMAQENVTQFGKDSYATYRESTVAACTLIMGEILTNPLHAEKFFGVHEAKQPKKQASELANEVCAGGCPGISVIANFFGDTIGLGDIRLSLQTFRDTGELAAWHAKHNPKAKPAKPEQPTVNPEAVAKFDRASHVKTFVDTVKLSHVPFEQQPAVAEQVVKRLKDHTEPKEPKAKRKRKARPRRSHDASVPRDQRMTAANIRKEIGNAVADAAETPEQREAAEEFARMTSLEASLVNAEAGLSRAVSAFRDMRPIINMLGSIESELSAVALDKLRKVRAHLHDIQEIIGQCAPALPRLTGDLAWSSMN